MNDLYTIDITTDIDTIKNPTKIIISNLYTGDRGKFEQSVEQSVEIISSGKGIWNNFMRNIPQKQKEISSCPQETIITITKNKKIAPILVLTELKYKGNIGSIVRSAVQSNIFESIIIITHKDYNISKPDIRYYSVMNSPLIPIIKVDSVQSFLDQIDKSRKLVCVNMHEKSMNIYDSKVKNILKNDNSYIIMGAEDNGISEVIQEVCDTHIEIPQLSSSINVSSAFMVILTVMNMVRYT